MKIKWIYPLVLVLAIIIIFLNLISIIATNNNLEIRNISNVFLISILIYTFTVIYIVVKKVASLNKSNFYDTSSKLKYNTKELSYRDNKKLILYIFFTFGIYLLYWMSKITKELNKEPTPTNWKKSNFDIVLLMLVTLGLYYAKWTKYVILALSDKPTDEWLKKFINSPDSLFIPFSRVFQIQSKINEILSGKAGDSDYNLIYKKYSEK